jgi:hypothetical protein
MPVDPSEALEVTFEFDREDFVDLHQVVLRRHLGGQRRRWKRLGLLGGLVVVLFVLWTALVVSSRGTTAFRSELVAVLHSWVGVVLGILLLLLMLLLLILGLLLWLMPRMAREQLSDEGSTLGTHVVRIDGSGIRLATPKASGQYDWSGVVDVFEGPRHVFLFVDTSAAVVVPKRAFPDDGAMRGFLERCRGLRQAAQGVGTAEHH